MAMGGRVDHVQINVAELANEIQAMVSCAEQSMHSSECCIFKVPNILSRHNQEAYLPYAFSIGPFYRGRALQETHNIKLTYLSELLSGRPGTHKVDLKHLIQDITHVHNAARNCYAGDIGMSDQDFIKILVIDACFLIELFRKNQDGQHDPIFSMACQNEFLWHDLILLENQIPWLVIDRLFKTITGSEESNTLVELAIHFLSDYIFFLPGIERDSNFIQALAAEPGIKHILDLVRRSMVLNFSIITTQNIESKTMPSATSLMEAGIKFNEDDSPSCLLEINFKDGVLDIPPLNIHDETESLFRNLIAFEQCLPNRAAIVTSYARLLDNLINTTADMEILTKNGIVHNWLNVDDVTKIFNKLYDDTFVKEFYYTTIIDEVNDYCRRRCPRYRRVLMRDYFKHPWALISVIAATILLILVFLQTLFTIIYK